MLQKPYRPPNPQEERELKAQLLNQVKQAWSLEELTQLSLLFSEPSFKLWQRYLSSLEEMLQREVWRRDMTWDKLNFMRGQMDVVERLKRAPNEIAQMRSTYKEDREEKS